MVARVYQTEAVVIKRINLGEADRILTLYTPELGKLKAIAKGSRRPKSKLGGHVELLTHSLLLIAKGRNLDIITQAQTIDNFLTLKEDLELLSCGFYIAELIDVFTGEDIEDHSIFNLLLSTLQQLTTVKDGENVLRYFELHLLDHLGYRPQLQRCAGCGTALQPETNFFASSQGGVLCRTCGYQEPLARGISLNTLKVLRLWQGCDYATASRVKINSELAAELKSIMREHIKYILERQVKSIAWMDKLSSDGYKKMEDNLKF